MASQHYNSYKVHAAKGDIALLTDTIRVALLTHNYTPDIDAHKVLSDVNTNETTGTNYTAGGVALSSVAVTEDDTGDRALFSAANPSWPNVTFTDARWAVVYKDTGVVSTSPLIAVIDLLAQQVCTAATFALNFSTSPAGVFYLG